MASPQSAGALHIRCSSERISASQRSRLISMEAQLQLRIAHQRHGCCILIAPTPLAPLCPAARPKRPPLAVGPDGNAARVLRLSASSTALLHDYTFYNHVFLTHQPQRLLALCEAYHLHLTKLYLANFERGFDERLLPLTAAEVKALEDDERDAASASASSSEELWYPCVDHTSPPFPVIVGWIPPWRSTGRALRPCGLSCGLRRALPQSHARRAHQLQARSTA